MSRCGGVNFSVGVCGGYRNQADCLVTIRAKELVFAIEDGSEFLENRFTGLMFGAGKWEGDGWNGQIPIQFLRFD